MNKINNSICALIAALAIGCQAGTVTSIADNAVSKNTASNNTSSVSNTVQTIRGKPLSVSETYGHGNGTVATVVDVDGKKVLAYIPLDQSAGGNGICAVAQATALFQSEIADGDDDFVELTGSYDPNGTFKISSLSANGYKVDF
ncbi:hypothetical protein HZA97_00860 [Candidatus Woesearchaeota archaeon]|nr:hypothetical protein [Candidatus Woesearchaeota archaeon]